MIAARAGCYAARGVRRARHSGSWAGLPYRREAARGRSRRGWPRSKQAPNPTKDVSRSGRRTIVGHQLVFRYAEEGEVEGDRVIQNACSPAGHLFFQELADLVELHRAALERSRPGGGPATHSPSAGRVAPACHRSAYKQSGLCPIHLPDGLVRIPYVFVGSTDQRRGGQLQQRLRLIACQSRSLVLVIGSKPGAGTEVHLDVLVGVERNKRGDEQADPRHA